MIWTEKRRRAEPRKGNAVKDFFNKAQCISPLSPRYSAPGGEGRGEGGKTARQSRVLFV